jgi:hypothetical protein
VEFVFQPGTVISAPQLPLDPIVISGAADGDLASVQPFADDLASGDVGSILRSCWMWEDEETAALFESPIHRGAFLEALSHPAQGAQMGPYWEGTYVTLLLYYEQLRLPYACPTVSASWTPSQARWTMIRAYAFHSGIPVHPGDGVDLALICDEDCGEYWDAHSYEHQWVQGRQAPIATATEEQWDRLRVLAEADIAVELLSNGCIRVRAVDGKTDALAYFTTASDYSLPYTLLEIL